MDTPSTSSTQEAWDDNVNGHNRVVCALIRIVQFVSHIWTLANAARSPRISAIAAA